MGAKVYFIGAGPGDPGLITVKARDIIRQADVIIYAGSLVNPQVLEWAAENVRLVDSARLDLDQIMQEMLHAAEAGRMVARLHCGDPSVYGAIAEQMARLDEHGIDYEVVPGVSSAFAAAAALKMEYTLPGITQTLILTRRAGRTPVPEQESLPALASHKASMAVFLSAGMLEETVQDLIAGGYHKNTPAAVVYRASWPDEKRFEGTLGTIVSATRAEMIDRQALIIVGEAVGRRLQEPSMLYAPEFGHGWRKPREPRAARMAVVTLTSRGLNTGRRIVSALEGADLYVPAKHEHETSGQSAVLYHSLREEIERIFPVYGSIVFVMATGIAVRMIANLLSSKWSDPAVVAMDDGGRNIISLVSGHWGGANDLTQRLSTILGGNPVITTESDVAGYPAVDCLLQCLTGGRVPDDMQRLARLQSMMLENREVGFYPAELSLFRGMRGHGNLHFFDSLEGLQRFGCDAGVIVTHLEDPPGTPKENFIVIHARDLVVGAGCHRGIATSEVEDGIREVFAKHGLSTDSIGMLCSIDRRQTEQGLLDCARGRNLSVKFFTAREINAARAVSPDSAHAQRALGVHGVAEPCAVLGAQGGEVIVPKQKRGNLTIAVARTPLSRMIDHNERKDHEQG